MERVSQRGGATQGWRARRAPLTFAVSCCALSVLVAVSGCRSGPSTPQNAAGDPLVGDVFPKGYAPEKPPPRKQQSKAPPALPAATSVGSNAAIAQGLRSADEDPLTSGGRRLAINGPGPQQAGAWQVTPSKPGGRTDALTANPGLQGPGFNLLPPQPVAGPVPLAPASGGAVKPQGGMATGGGYDQLQAQLKARKVVWQRQETLGEGFKFTCQVPNPFNRDFNRVYEATARDYKAAILMVIEQIDRDQQR